MPTNYASDTALLIPSYQPDGRLEPYVRALSGAGYARVIVVDDGSGDKYRPIFESLKPIPRVTVLTHEQNRGKGAALKTAMQFCQDECPECAYVLTADSDGQHTAKDVERMAKRLHEQDKDALLLGARDFSQPDVPPKSRFGNRLTTVIFFLLYGRRIGDTQTGLRGFSRAMLPMMLLVKGDRYEYEMNMLIDCAMSKTPILSLPIETVYENNNENSHFRPLQDSARIYKVIFARFFKYISSSLGSSIIDIGAFALINAIFERSFPSLDYTVDLFVFSIILRVLLATIIARCISGTMNYYVNKRFVFGDKSSAGRSFPRYLVVFFLTMLLSGVFTSNLHLWLRISESVAKIIGDTVLFLLGYYLQRKWVFVKTAKTPDTDKSKA